MTDEKELHALIARIESAGGVVTVEYDAMALVNEGRTSIDTVQIWGIKGIGPHPMGPIGAAEAMRKALANL